MVQWCILRLAIAVYICVVYHWLFGGLRELSCGCRLAKHLFITDSLLGSGEWVENSILEVVWCSSCYHFWFAMPCWVLKQQMCTNTIPVVVRIVLINNSNFPWERILSVENFGRLTWLRILTFREILELTLTICLLFLCAAQWSWPSWNASKITKRASC